MHAGTKRRVAAKRTSPGIGKGLLEFPNVSPANSSERPPAPRSARGARSTSVDMGANSMARVAAVTAVAPVARKGDWGVQSIYQVGDRAFFGGHVYRALERHQASAGNRPDVTPSVWALVL